MQAFHHINQAIHAWRRRRSYRADLDRLLTTGDHLVRDTGFSREDAMREITKPAWQA